MGDISFYLKEIKARKTKAYRLDNKKLATEIYDAVKIQNPDALLVDISEGLLSGQFIAITPAAKKDLKKRLSRMKSSLEKEVNVLDQVIQVL